MWRGTIIENSLKDPSVLRDFTIRKSWTADDWKLHDVVVDEDAIPSFQKLLDVGPWYIHFYSGDDVVVVYRDALFQLRHSDHSTWRDAIAHGVALGIPKEQLDFVIEE